MKLKKILKESLIGITAIIAMYSGATYLTISTTTGCVNPIKQLNLIENKVYQIIEEIARINAFGSRSREVLLIKEKKKLDEEYKQKRDNLKEIYEKEFNSKMKNMEETLEESREEKLERLVQSYERK